MSELYQIDFVEGVPVYRQLVDRIRANIKSGVMENGMQLPTVRELAGQLGLALGTVKRAYDELGKEGLVQQVQGRGTFVSYRHVDSESRKERAMSAIDEMLRVLEEMNFSMTETRIYLDLKLRQREMVQENLKVALVECNPEVLIEFPQRPARFFPVGKVKYFLRKCEILPAQWEGCFASCDSDPRGMRNHRSTPRNFLARMPTMKDSTATLMLMTAISRKRERKGWSWATLV